MSTWRGTSTTSAPVAGFCTKLSSAGLVYKHFGLIIIAKLMNLTKDDEQVIVCPPQYTHQSGMQDTFLFLIAPYLQVKKVYLAVYKHFMEAIDAIDNGQLHQKHPYALSCSVSRESCIWLHCSVVFPSSVCADVVPSAKQASTSGMWTLHQNTSATQI